MVHYSINDIEKLSGVKAHTLRMWEKRYSILPVRRTNTNIRYYLDEDLHLILNIAHLNKKGTKISKIACLSPTKIQKLVADLNEINIEYENDIDGLMLSLIELNEFKFLKILNHRISVMGFEKAINEIIFPLLDKLAMMWESGSLKAIHEIFINDLIKRKIAIEIDKLPFTVDEKKKKVMIFLPDMENQELSILYLYFILKKNKINTLYLGPNVQVLDIKDAVEIFNPDLICTLLFDTVSYEETKLFINSLSTFAQESKIFIASFLVQQSNMELPKNCFSLNNLDEILIHV